MNKTSIFAEWRGRLNALGFGDFFAELFRPGSPLAFLTAQGLRVAQPTLGAFADDSGLAAIAALADRLERAETESRS
ncbi:MAG: hypothetical protein FJ030_01750 [Chloroflexi bacterium]|nr:hypothetical protein [Chloroflexota bacterium]